MKRFITSIFVLAVIAGSISIPALSQNVKKKQERPAASQQKADPDVRGTDKAPVIVKMLPSESANEKAAREKKESDEKDQERTWNRWLALATLFLSILTLLALFRQLRIMQVQNRIQDGVLEATVANAETAARQKEINARQVSHFERKERAWLYPENLQTLTERRHDKNLQFIFSMMWRNGGNTTALNVRMNILSEIFVGDMPADFDFETRYDRADRPTYIGPNSFGTSQAVAITGSEVQAVLDGHLAFYIWGKIIYEDIFAGTESRETKFCWRLVGAAGDVVLSDKIQLNFFHDPRYSSIS